jgi:hypothetical protein
MTYIGVIDGRHCCYVTAPDLRSRRYLGCSHETPRQAIAHKVPFYVSPLRVSGDDPLVSAPSGTGVGSSPKPRRG